MSTHEATRVIGLKCWALSFKQESLEPKVEIIPKEQRNDQ